MEETKKTTGTKKMSLKEKLFEVRKKILLIEFEKSGKNKYSNYTYFELKDFQPQLLELLYSFNIFPTFNIISKDEKQVATLKFYDIGTQEEEEFVIEIPEDDSVGKIQGIQALGAKYTYLKRYAYMVYFDILDNDIVSTLPNTDNSKKIKEKVENKEDDKKYLTIKTKTELGTIMKEKGVAPEELKEVASKELEVDAEDFLEEHADYLKETIEKISKEKGEK